MDNNIIYNYFPAISEIQKDRFGQLGDLYAFWNEKINVVSRKDIENLYEKHILHSLSIAKFITFKPETTIMDIGTGGGFPGIPLAILFPECRFCLVDSIGKKIKVVEGISETLGLKNVIALNKRAEEVKEKFDFIVSRAVTTIPSFMKWTINKIKKDSFNDIDNGIIYIKGGEVGEELAGIKKDIKIKNISEYFNEEFFETKKIIYIKG